MVNKQASFILTFIAFYALFSMFAHKPMAESGEENRKVHIVYLGERQYDDTKLTTQSHHDLLASVLGSKEKSSESMVYSYRHGFSGFAAKLTKSQAQKLAVQDLESGFRHCCFDIPLRPNHVTYYVPMSLRVNTVLTDQHGFF